MKTKTQRVLFLAIISTGVVLPWATLLVSALAFAPSPGVVFRPIIKALPFFPVTVLLVAAWWALPFVVFAYLWRSLVTAEFEPLRRHPLLMLLGIPVAVFSLGASSILYGLYIIAFLVYAMLAAPSWGLRTPVSRTLFALFGLTALILFTLLAYSLMLGIGGHQLRQMLVSPLGVLGYMTGALLLGYLFAKPIDLLITWGEPVPEVTARPGPSDWIVIGNALACSLALLGTVLLYSRFMGSATSRYEIGEALAGMPIWLALSGLIAGTIVGVFVYAFVPALMRSRRDPRLPLHSIVLAILPGLVLGLSPGLVGERAVKSLLGGDYLGIYFGYVFGEVAKIAVSPDGTRVAADAAGDLLVWDTAAGEPILRARYEPSSRWVATSGLSWSPDSHRLAVASPTVGIVIMDSGTGKSSPVLQLPSAGPWAAAGVSGTAFGPDAGWLIAAATNGMLYRYALPGGALEQTWQSPVAARNMTAIALSPDGRRLAITGVSASEANPMGGFVAVLDATNGESLWVVDQFEQIADQLAFSPDGSLLLMAGTDRPPRLVDAASGRPGAELRQHCPVPPPDSFRSTRHYAAFLGSGDSIAAACSEGTIEVCKAADGECRVIVELQLLGIDGLAAYPDGRHVAVLANGNTVTLWDLQAAEPRQVYRHR